MERLEKSSNKEQKGSGGGKFVETGTYPCDLSLEKRRGQGGVKRIKSLSQEPQQAEVLSQDLGLLVAQAACSWHPWIRHSPSLEKHQVSKTNSPSNGPDTISSCTGKHSWCNLEDGHIQVKAKKTRFLVKPMGSHPGAREEGQRVPLLSKKCISSESSFSLKKQKIGSWEHKEVSLL